MGEAASEFRLRYLESPCGVGVGVTEFGVLGWVLGFADVRALTGNARDREGARGVRGSGVVGDLVLGGYQGALFPVEAVGAVAVVGAGPQGQVVGH